MYKALLIIDVQNAFNDPKWGIRNNLNAEDNIKQLLTIWREREYEVIFIRHTSQKESSIFHLNKQGYQIKDIVKPRPEEKIIDKEVNSAFIGTSLEDYLNEREINEVVITGLTTPHCVSTTTRMSGNLGFRTYIISDATATFGLSDHKGDYIDPQTVHDISLATVHGEFATVCSTNDYIENYI